MYCVRVTAINGVARIWIYEIPGRIVSSPTTAAPPVLSPGGVLLLGGGVLSGFLVVFVEVSVFQESACLFLSQTLVPCIHFRLQK